TLLHGDARREIQRQDAVPILVWLLVEELPGRHRHDARANPLDTQLLVSLDGEAQLTARRDRDDLGPSPRGLGEHVRAARGARRGTPRRTAPDPGWAAAGVRARAPPADDASASRPGTPRPPRWHLPAGS